MAIHALPLQRPGLAKASRSPLVLRRRLELVAAVDGRMRCVVDTADVVSEGMPRVEGDALVYYGTTSLLLLRAALGGELPERDLEPLVALLRVDPHLRLRAVRVAHREATARAGAGLGPVHAELTVGLCPRGVMIAVDVVARVHRARASRIGG